MRTPQREEITPEQIPLLRHDLEQAEPRRFGPYWNYRPRIDAIVTITRRYVPNWGRVLDAGCAQGVVALTLAELGYDVCAMDLRQSYIAYARLKQEWGEVEYVVGDATRMPFRDGFDCVVLGEIIEHVAHPEDLLRCARRAVRPGGIVVVTTPNGGYVHTGLPTARQIADRAALQSKQFRPDADGHLFLFTRSELAEEGQEAGLRLVEHQFLCSPFTNGHLGVKRLGAWVPQALLSAIERGSTRVPSVWSRLATQQVAVFRPSDEA